MTKTLPKPKKREPIPRIFVGHSGQRTFIDKGDSFSLDEGILIIQDDEGNDIAMFKNWDFAIVEWEHEELKDPALG